MHPISISPVDVGPFAARHIGPREDDVADMLSQLGYASLEALVAAVVPEDIRRPAPLTLPSPRTEAGILGELRDIAGRNHVMRSLIGMGYYGCHTPTVILRNVLENPAWYTAYTPYQAEISQGRLEALFNFQTLVSELTALPIANASLLDEPTAAAEAMAMCHRVAAGKGRKAFVVSAGCHPQTIAVVRTRAEPLGIEVRVADDDALCAAEDAFGVLLQYPATTGEIVDYRAVIEASRERGIPVVMACDLLALALLEPPGALGAHIAVGSSQRFGMPMGCGGPHAAFMAASEEFKRTMPGRIVGCIGRFRRQARVSPRAANTRTAHPAREGDEQHLHGAGSPGRRRELLCGLSRR